MLPAPFPMPNKVTMADNRGNWGGTLWDQKDGDKLLGVKIHTRLALVGSMEDCLCCWEGIQ